MKPRPATLNNIKASLPVPTQPDAPKDNNSGIIGVVVTTAVVTTIIVSGYWLLTNRQLKMRITSLEKPSNKTKTDKNNS
jgi:predicted secreted protein